MRDFLSIIALLACLSVYGQEDFDFSSFVPGRYVRERCLFDNNEDGSVSPSRLQYRTSMVQSDAPLVSKGSPEIVVCLANFSDVKFSVAEGDDALVELFDRFFNAPEGEKIGSNVRSLSEYFRLCSGGQFTPHFNVLRPVSVAYSQSQSASNRAAFRDAALLALDGQVRDRIDDFDADGDGVVDGVIIVFPGMGANTGGKGPHACCWAGKVIIDRHTPYATQLVGPEMGKNGDNVVLNGIGLFAHEMSHMLGLPDLYPTANVPSSGFNPLPGMDHWSLMDYGEYTANGYQPTPYTAYEKNYMGWIQLKELYEPSSIIGMRGLSDGGDAYVVYNDNSRKEYYILENRNAGDPLYSAMDKLFGSGLQIYHVDEVASRWNNNTVNTDKDHQCVTIVPANGHFESIDNYSDGMYGDNSMSMYYSEMAGHLWPLKESHYSPVYGRTWNVLEFYGIKDNNSLTDEGRSEGDRVAPAAVLYNENSDGSKLMHKPVTNIVLNDNGSVNFDFMGGGETAVDEVGADVDEWDDLLAVHSLSGVRVAVCRRSYLFSGAVERGVYVVRNLRTGISYRLLVGTAL